MSQISDVRPVERTGATPQVHAGPTANPSRIFQTINAFQQTGALRAAIELDVFTAIAEGLRTAPEIAGRAHAAERGIRILCDYLVMLGLLTKHEGRYGLAEDAAVFLDRRSPAYMGTIARFLNAPEIMDAYRDLTQAVRQGGTTMSGKGSVDPEDPIWVEFAHSMAPLMYMPARRIAELVGGGAGERMKVLDIAAGHGLFGIAIARQNPQAQIVALDWRPVLEVALANARKEGVEARYSTLPGSAFEVDFGNGYDLVLLTNFLHHFNPITCEGLLRKVHAALVPGGRVVLLEFVPNDDRVSPPETAFFSIIMLGTTPDGDAYTFAEYQEMLSNAGFGNAEHIHLEPMPESVIIASK
ncbi:MAG: methyltransferase domain-containing protein [Acidobacteriia bacterium]|nr:methyltransferase domain-containing protein [Terriglobia bacterium]